MQTYGLPSKFSFYTHGFPDRHYIVDCEDTDSRGRPLLYLATDRDDNTHGWSHEDIARNLNDGTWILLDVFDDGKSCIDVNDLL